MAKLENTTFKLAVIILAAGASRRMGRPKLLLPWGQTSVLGHLLRQSGALNAQQIAVVCAAEAAALLQELVRLDFRDENRIFNATPERGMFSSIQCAANWTGWQTDITHWLILLGDQPHLRLETLEALIDLGRRNPEKICQPMRGQRRKHPVLMPKQAFQQLRNTSANDLKMFLVDRASELSGFASRDAGLDCDMDTPEDYEKLLSMITGPLEDQKLKSAT